MDWSLVILWLLHSRDFLKVHTGMLAIGICWEGACFQQGENWLGAVSAEGATTRVSRCLSYSVQSRDVPSPPHMAGLVTWNRKGCSTAHTAETHSLSPQESVLVPAAPETDFRAICMVLTITAVPNNTLTGVYICQILFIHFVTLVSATKFTIIKSVCVPGSLLCTYSSRKGWKNCAGTSFLWSRLLL